MSSFKKRGLVALAIGVAAALAVTIPVVVAGTLAAGSGGVPPTAAAPTPATVSSLTNCVSNRMGFATNTAQALSTTSTSFVQVPGMSVGFDTPSLNTCVEITLSAYTFATGGELEMWSAFVDSTQCQPGEIQASGDDDENSDGEWARTHAYTFICFVTHDPFHPHHTATAQFRSFFGGTVFIHRPTMTVRWGA